MITATGSRLYTSMRHTISSGVTLGEEKPKPNVCTLCINDLSESTGASMYWVRGTETISWVGSGCGSGSFARRYTLASLEALKRSVLLACSGSTSSCASVWIFSPSWESVKNSHKFSSCNSPRILSFLKTMFDGHTLITKELTVEENLTSSVFS